MEQHWIDVLSSWPADLPRRGLAVTNNGDSVEFSSFMLRGQIALLERDRPDSQGGRRVMLHLSQLAAIKIMDPVEMDRFRGFGFKTPAAA